MLVSKDIINDLYNNISEEKLKLAKKYNDENKIKIIKATYDDKTLNYMQKLMVIGILTIFLLKH